MDELQKKALSRLEARCARQEYCVRDIRTKALKAMEGDAARAEEIVESLLRDGFVDDSRYAAAFAREKSSLTGWGPVKIRFALRAKGVSDEVASEALEQIDSARAGAKLEKLMENKAASLAGDPQIRLKLIKFALSRGYTYEEVQRVMENY